MASFDDYAHRAISRAQKAKKFTEKDRAAKAAKEQAQRLEAHAAEQARYKEPEEGIPCRTCGQRITGSLDDIMTHATTHS